MQLLLLAISAITIYILYAFADYWARLRAIPHLVRDGASGGLPFVSVIIPVRNEERNIARCITGVLAQHYGNYEVVVVDDGSTDATPTMLAHYAAQDSRLRIIQGRALPAGWIGKCNACQHGSESAHGEWLLFLDADTTPQPELLARLVATAERRRLDMLTIYPFLELGSFWERMVLPPFIALLTAIFPFQRLDAPNMRPDEMIANGQCIFVKQTAYAAIGGHGAVRGEILEDVRFAQALRAAGFTIGGAAGMQELRVRMYTNGREVAAGFIKNASAGYQSGAGRSFGAMARLLAMALIPLWLIMAGLGILLSGGGIFAWAILAHGLITFLVATTFWGIFLLRLYAINPLYALLWPIGLMSYCLIAAYGMWRVYRKQGVDWKGRRYTG